MASIRITPEELEVQGSQLVNLAQNYIISLLNQVERQVSIICDSWDGLAQDAFLQSYQEMKKTLDVFPQIVEGIGQQAIAAAQAFGQVDDQISSSISNGG